jgi:hypothetical protein
MWAVSRKRMSKSVTTERVIRGNQLNTEHGLHEYGN